MFTRHLAHFCEMKPSPWIFFKKNARLNFLMSFPDLFMRCSPSFSRSFHQEQNGSDDMDVVAGKRFKRKKHAFSQNRTMARMMEVSVNIFGKHFILEEQIRDAMQDHAYRRVQLFYYLSVGYYGEGCGVDIARTKHQHGASKLDSFHSAHSSILPNVHDDFFEILEQSLLQNGLNMQSKQKLLALGLPEKRVSTLRGSSISSLPIRTLLSDLDTKNGLFNKECHFYHNMNSTVELPKSVNEYDSILEKVIRRIALDILNRVSRNNLHPYHGLTEFVDKTQHFLQTSKIETCRKITCLENIQALEQQLWTQEQNIEVPLPSYCKTITQLSHYYKKIQQYRKFSLPVNIKKRLPWQRELFTLKLKPPKELSEHIKSQIATRPPWNPKSVDPVIQSLRNSLVIIKHQKAGSVLPPYALLSGKMVGGKRIPMTEEDLFNQKLEIISRSSRVN